ncbi:MAG: hypothetical protein K1X28_00995 [Parachlamydiales bacterium]|nr:hypothetical protein [Parachlamydiales bacterium]
MEIYLNTIAEEANNTTSGSPWITLLANWSQDLNSLLSNPNLQENLLGQIEALAPIAAASGSTIFANDFIVFVKDYNAFIANPNSSTLAVISADINNKLIPKAPLNPFDTDKALAENSCELLLYKINPYNTGANQNEIAGMISAIVAFTPQAYQFQAQQIQTDYANYLKYNKDPTYLQFTQTAINALIGMLDPAILQQDL